MKSNKLIFAVTALVLATIACNLLNRAPSAEEGQTTAPNQVGTDTGGQPENPDPTQATSETQTSSSESGSGQNSLVPGEPFDFSNPNFEFKPELFNTYKASLNYAFSAANGVTGSLLMEGATQIEPFETSQKFTTFGQAVMGTEESMIFAQFDGTEYLYSPDFGCVSGDAGLQGNPFDVALDTYGGFTGQAAFSGEEFVNGVDTYVYTITSENIDNSSETGFGISEVKEGRINLARDGAYVVRMVLIGTGVNEGLSQDADLEGDLYYELNFYDFDVPVTFEIPEGCTGANAGDFSVPLPEDVFNVSQFGEILNFSTALSLSDAADFFERELPARGCSEPEVIGDGSSMISMYYENCEFGAVQIILTTESGETVGTVFINP